MPTSWATMPVPPAASYDVDDDDRASSSRAADYRRGCALLLFALRCCCPWCYLSRSQSPQKTLSIERQHERHDGPAHFVAMT